jgi:hypothetical protein
MLIDNVSEQQQGTSFETLTEPALNTAQIHISKAQLPEEDPQMSSKAIKLMHRFTPGDVKAKMDLAEKL